MNFSGIFHCYNCYKSNKMKKQYYEVWLSLKKIGYRSKNISKIF